MEMPPKKTASRNSSDNEKKEFVWCDDEVELLLNVTADYKATKAAESVDWESVKKKYKDVLTSLWLLYPKETLAFLRASHTRRMR